jgi:hypothetical protein
VVNLEQIIRQNQIIETIRAEQPEVSLLEEMMKEYLGADEKDGNDDECIDEAHKAKR